MNEWMNQWLTFKFYGRTIDRWLSMQNIYVCTNNGIQSNIYTIHSNMWNGHVGLHRSISLKLVVRESPIEIEL